MKLILMTVIFMSLVSCGIAPITSPHTARTLGKDKKELKTGFGPAPMVEGSYGVKDNWDVGVGLELQFAPVVSLWNKYSFNGKGSEDDEEKVIFAVYSGVFGASGELTSYGAYVGPVVSYKKKWFEVYFIPRINYVQFDSGSVDLEDEDGRSIVEFDVDSGSFTYGQFTFGINFWFRKGTGVSISGTGFVGDSLDSDIAPGIQLILGL